MTEEVGGVEFSEDLLDKLAGESYTEIAGQRERSPQDIYFSRDCELVSRNLHEKLEKNGVKSDIVHYGGWDITSHEFLIVNDNMVADPTWQQFLEKPNPELPHVFLSPIIDIKSKLTQYGIPEDKHHIWLNSRYGENRSNKLVDKVV